jgi:AcrR family transcriptional regulator
VSGARSNWEVETAREMMRQGGRSARIQKEVHAAVLALLKTVDRDALTVPLIAERAGVTPSTIYRRWGDLSQLLADVALERLRPIADPNDTGSTASDLEAYIIQSAEEMSSEIGRSVLLDVLADEGLAVTSRCCSYTQDHLALIAARAAARGEPPLDVADIIDRVWAPIVYHILFRDRDVTPDYCRSLLATLRLPASATV